MSAESAVIIGAGPAGLTAAYELAKAGIKSTILEADDLVGGISRTVNFRGYRFDIGGHRFFSKVQLVNDLWDEILDEDFLLRPRLSRIHYRGHFFDYPLKPMNAFAGLGLIETMRICASYAKTKVLPSRREDTFEQWVVNRFGHRLYSIFFKTYTEKVWGIPCSEISADWAAQRIKNLSLVEAVRNAIFGNTRTRGGEVITTLIDQFHYPRYGPGQMWECCERILSEKDCPTLREVRVEKIRHDKGRVECVYAKNADGEMVEYGADHFISSMPLRELIHSLDPAPPDEVLKAANRLRYRDYLTSVLIVNRADVFPDNWIYIHSPDVKMGRIQNYKNWSPQMVPDATRTSLGLEYFLWDTDSEWSWPDDQLIELGIKECAQIGMIEPSEVEDGTVVRMRKAYPVYDQAYQETVETLKRYILTFTNLQTVGRNGLHRYNNQDHSMLTAVYAARNVTGGAYDVWAVNTEKEYHEEGETKDVTAGDRMIPTTVSVPAQEEPEAIDAVIKAAFAELDAIALGSAVGLVAGLGLFLATAMLLLKGGVQVGKTLALLGHYLPGFGASWGGAIIGMIEVAVGGFAMGYLIAVLLNWSIWAYAALAKRKAEAKEGRDLLDRV